MITAHVVPAYQSMLAFTNCAMLTRMLICLYSVVQAYRQSDDAMLLLSFNSYDILARSGAATPVPLAQQTIVMSGSLGGFAIAGNDQVFYGTGAHIYLAKYAISPGYLCTCTIPVSLYLCHCIDLQHVRQSCNEMNQKRPRPENSTCSNFVCHNLGSFK